MDPSEIAVTTLLPGQSAFYASGRNNSFASLDMMNGYNGIDNTNDEANVLAVTVQTHSKQLARPCLVVPRRAADAPGMARSPARFKRDAIPRERYGLR